MPRGAALRSGWPAARSLVAAFEPHCSVPGCTWEVRADGLCIEHLEVREISRPYGADYRDLRLAEDCVCLVHKRTGDVKFPCEAHQRQADREVGQ